MKKIFSAFLLMTMMVASVGSFVSCSDIEDAIAKVENTANDNAAQIKDLEGKIAALQTALATAQADAAAAKAEANAAKQAAATARAEAIEAALAEIAKVQDDVDAANAEIKKINDALAGKATKEAVELLENTVKEYKALTDENAKAISEVEAAIKALKDGGVTAEKFAEVVAQMKAIDEALVNFVKAMANQIQSITYVPEKANGEIASSHFSYGSGAAASNVIAFTATYDVRPANLASTITVDNAEFKGVPVTKAEAAESIEVMKVEADDATGRVVVYGTIAKAQKAYTALTGATSQVAVALNVNTEAQVDSTDLGTKISSNYANIANVTTATSVYDSFVLATADNKTAVKAYTNNEIEVPYNYVGTAAAEKALFPVTVKFEIVAGKYITPAEASVLLGKTLDVKYTAKVGTTDVKAVYTAAPGATDKNDDDEITSPILVTGTDLSATATLVVSPDYEANETIGASAKLALGTWTVDNVNIGLTAEATYTIVDGKSDASVVIAPITKTWVYTDADNAWATVDAWKAVERNVTLPTELTSVESLIPTTGYLYTKWNVGTAAAPSYKAAAAKVEYMSSKAVKVVEIVGATYNANGTYTVTGTANPLTYAQAAEKTYTFEGVFQNPDTEIDYKVALDVVLGGMPDDKEIDLGTMPALVSNVPTKLDVNFVGKALAEHSAYLTDVKFSDVYSSFNNGTVTVTNADATAYSGTGVVTFTAAQKAANQPEVEASQVEIKQFAKGTYNVKYVQTVYGVKYTYKAVVEVAEPTYTLDTISQFVQNGQVIVSGVTTMPTFDVVKTNGVVTSSTLKTPADFESDVINLKDYFMVSGLDKTYAGDVKVVYTVKTYAADTKFTALWGAETTIAKNTALATVSANSTVSATDGKTLTDAKVTWASDVDVDKVEVTAYLVKASATETTDKDLAKVAYDKETITIVQRDRISSVAQIANTGTVEYKSGANVVDFLKFIETKDFNGNVISNPYATNTTNYWHTPTGKGTEVEDAKVAALYGQEIKIGTPTCDLPTAAVAITNDQLVFTNNSAELQSNVVVTIPVYVGYEYDNYGSTAKKVEVKVTFTPKNY